MESWSSDVIRFDPSIIDESKRIIEGIATAPVYDRVNELITADAIKKALPDYMKLPVVTVLHKDYAVGVTKEAKILDDGSLHIRVQLKDTPDVDGIWDLIKSGVLNAFSISGSRTESTCSMRAGIGTPCVTSGIHLSTITICGEDKANQKAHIDYINKTLFGDTNMTEEINEVVSTVIEDPVEKTVEDSVIVDAVDHALEDKIDLLIKTIEGMKKEEEPKVENDLSKSLGDLATSMSELNTKLAGFEERLSAIENTKIEKGGIVMDESGKVESVGNIRVEDYIKNRFMRN